MVHVGAGISTSAGIRDFRGKDGVWTKLQQQHKSSSSARPQLGVEDTREDPIKCESDVDKFQVKAFDETVPTTTHMILKGLCEAGLVKHIVSQNVDGLFLKANLNRSFISELHGNFYLDECTKCRSRFIRSTSSPTMRLTRSNIKCSNRDGSCKGYLRDTILDWESSIPYNELRVATRESKRCKLHVCIGTSLQLRPSKDLVCNPKIKSNKLVVINLQPTNFDRNADVVINYYSDYVMTELANELDLDVPQYDSSQDPTKDVDRIGKMWKK